MRTLLLFSTLLLCLNSYADEVIQLENITVEANNKNFMNSDYQVFQRNDFAYRYQNLTSFLQQQNGLQIQQAGGLGNPALVSIRGASANQTTLLINGISSNNNQYGGYDLNSIPLNQIENIEISRSGSSFELADQAIGGTINIITREGTNNQNINLNLGSEETFSTSFSSSLNQNLSIQIDHQQSANNYDYPVPSPISGSNQHHQVQALENSEFHRTSIQLVQYFKGISARIRLNKKNKNIPDYFRNDKKNDASLNQKDAVFSLQSNKKLEHKNKIDNFYSEHLWKVFHKNSNEHYKDRMGVIGLGQDNDKLTQSRTEAQWHSKLLFKRWQFQTQLSAYEESFLSQYLDDDDSYLCTTPQGNCDQIAYKKSRKILIGIRWSNKPHSQQISADLYQSHATNYNRKRSSVIDSEEKNQSFIGYNIKYSLFHDTSETHFSIKHSNRHPSLYQLFGDRGLLLGNPDLLDETSSSYSIDHLYRINNKQQINSAIFYRQLEDAIVPVYDSRGIGRYENSKDAYIAGIEWRWRYRKYHFYSHLGVDIYHSKSFDNNVKSFDNKQIAGIYHNSLSFTSGWTQQRHSLELVNRINGNLYIDRSNLISGDNHQLTDINYQYQYSQLSLGLSIKNLTNIQYKDFTNRPAIGRQWIIFTHYNF